MAKSDYSVFSRTQIAQVRTLSSAISARMALKFSCLFARFKAQNSIFKSRVNRFWMKLSGKIDSALLKELKSLVSREREVTTEILHYLREVESRKLHIERGYSSLFEFTVRELGYSEGSAHRRISAMRLLKTLPELELKIRSGELTLTTAARAQGFFKEEAKRRNISLEEKKATVESLFNQSTRECERTLAAISPASALPKEKERAVSEELTQIQFLADRELLGKLERLKGLLAHRNFEGSYAVLFQQLADLALKKLDPLHSSASKKCRSPFPTEAKISKASAQNKAEQQVGLQKSTSAPNLAPSSSIAPNPKPSRFIPIAIRRAVRIRDQNLCTYTDRKTKHRCNSPHALDFDHRVPLVMGGETTTENLRLLCQAHHRLMTEKLSALV